MRCFWMLLLFSPVILRAQPVLNYKPSTAFVEKGFLNGTGIYDDTFRGSSLIVSARGGNKIWNFSGFKGAYSLENYFEPIEGDTLYHARHFEVIDPNSFNERHFRCSDYGLSWYLPEPETGELVPKTLLTFPQRFGDLFVLDSARLGNGKIKPDTVLEAFAWGRLITPYRSYTNTLVMRYPGYYLDTVFSGNNHNHYQVVESKNVTYTWYRPENGQYLFRIDSFIQRRSYQQDSYTTVQAYASYFSPVPMTSGDPSLIKFYRKRYLVRINEAVFSVRNDRADALCFQFLNVLGIEVLPRQCIPGSEDWTQVAFNTAALTPGLYFVHILGEDIFHYQRVYVAQ